MKSSALEAPGFFITAEADISNQMTAWLTESWSMIENYVKAKANALEHVGVIKVAQNCWWNSTGTSDQMAKVQLECRTFF